LAYGAITGAPSLAILDTSNGQELWQSPKQNGRVYGVGFSPDGEWLASTAAWKNECRLSLWDAKTGTEITRWQQEYDAQVEHGNWIKCLSFSQDNSRLLSAGIATPIRLWRLKENRTEVLGK
jgi:WD40 repeat protein